jgi:hypothetical protein
MIWIVIYLLIAVFWFFMKTYAYHHGCMKFLLLSYNRKRVSGLIHLNNRGYFGICNVVIA